MIPDIRHCGVESFFRS